MNQRRRSNTISNPSLLASSIDNITNIISSIDRFSPIFDIINQLGFIIIIFRIYRCNHNKKTISFAIRVQRAQPLSQYATRLENSSNNEINRKSQQYHPSNCANLLSLFQFPVFWLLLLLIFILFKLNMAVLVLTFLMLFFRHLLMRAI